MSQPEHIILAYGEVLWDLLPTGPVLGGAPFNFANRLHALGNRALIVSRLGTDELGDAARQEIAAFGMESYLLQTDAEHPTGTVHITFDAEKTADIRIVPQVAYDYIAFTEPLSKIAATADCICFGTVAQRGQVSRTTLSRLLDCAPQALKVFDINLRKDCYTRETVAASLARMDVLKINGPEAGELARMFGLPFISLPEFCDAALRQWPLQCCVVTLEDRGVFIATSAGERVYVPGFQVDLVDPLGAGDAFMAGFLHRFLRGQSLADSGRFGNLLGAIVATQRGATQPITSDEIDRFKSTNLARCCDPRLMEFAGQEGSRCHL